MRRVFKYSLSIQSGCICIHTTLYRSKACTGLHFKTTLLPEHFQISWIRQQGRIPGLIWVRFSQTGCHPFGSEFGPCVRGRLCLQPAGDNYIACSSIWQHLPGKNRLFVSTQTSGSQTHVFGVSTWVSSGIFLFGQSFGTKHLGKLGMGEVCRAPRNSAAPGFWPPKRKTSEWKRESWVCFLAPLSGHVGSCRH